MLHADHLGALFVDRRGVEIVDLEVLVRTHRMRHRACILGELRATQIVHGRNPLDGARAHVRREFLVAKHGQAFLQRQLEPVAAGDPVAGPVVEVFVADHAFDRLVVAIGRRGRIGEHKLAVEDVETFVLHRAHVEIVGAEDHEAVEVVFPPVALLIPAHRVLQRFHRVRAPREVARR